MEESQEDTFLQGLEGIGERERERERLCDVYICIYIP